MTQISFSQTLECLTIPNLLVKNADFPAYKPEILIFSRLRVSFGMYISSDCDAISPRINLRKNIHFDVYNHTWYIEELNNC